MLYVQDVKSASGAAIWKGVFLADVSSAVSPRITLAEQGILVSEGPDRLHLHSRNGSTHETDPKNPDHYQISTFEQTDIPIQLPSTDAKQEREPTATGELTTPGLLSTARAADPISAAGTTLNSTAGCIADRLHCAGPGRNSARTIVEEGRQIDRLRSYHHSRVLLIIRRLDRCFSGSARQSVPRCWESGCQTFCFSWAAHFCLAGRAATV